MITRQDLLDLREGLQDDVICILDVLGVCVLDVSGFRAGSATVTITVEEAEELLSRVCQAVVDRLEPLLGKV
jgi:hypothetical protein